MPKQPGGWRVFNLLRSFTSKKQKRTNDHVNKSVDKENVGSSSCFDCMVTTIPIHLKLTTGAGPSQMKSQDTVGKNAASAMEKSETMAPDCQAIFSRYSQLETDSGFWWHGIIHFQKRGWVKWWQHSTWWLGQGFKHWEGLRELEWLLQALFRWRRGGIWPTFLTSPTWNSTHSN